MTLFLHDTMARAKRPFVPVNAQRVTMYVCGPTVYNFAHIGNARPVWCSTCCSAWLRHLYGEDHVVYAANVTDVDDKINLKAAQEACRIGTITDRYLAAYNADMAVARALTPTFQPRATQTMDAIVRHDRAAGPGRGRLCGRGPTCCSDTQAFGDYGKLSGRSLDDMIARRAVDVAPYKRHPADFVLWKPSQGR